MGLPALLLALALGLACAPYLQTPPPWFVPPLLALTWYLARRRPLSLLLLSALLWTLGASLYHLHLDPPSGTGHVRAFINPEKLTLQARVLRISQRPGERWSADLEADRVIFDGIAAPVRGRIRLYVDTGPRHASPGDVVRLRTRLRAPRLFGTPGEFDFPRHLARQGIFATAFVPTGEEVVSLGPAPDGGFGLKLERQRSEIGAFIARSVNPGTAPLVKALVLGDKGGISPAQRDLLARAGLSHLFAISGLHLGLIALLLYVTARALYRRSTGLLLRWPPGRVLPALLAPALLAYLLLSGGALATRRAFLMGLAGALLLLWSRRTPPVKMLAATAFGFLLLDPLALFEPAWQLSFAGVLGILSFLPRWRIWTAPLPSPLRPPLLLFMSTAAATVATAPIVLWHFHMAAPAGLLSNLAAVPAVGFAAVPIGLAGALLLPWWPDGAAALFRGCALTIDAVLAAAERIVNLPGLGGWVHYPSPGETAALLLLTGALLMPSPGPRGWPARWMLSLAAAILLWPGGQSDALRVTALGVGQGDAFLLSHGGQTHYLVDGGGLYSDTFDVGQRLVAPALGRSGIHALKAVVLTHDHPDHRKGLIHILEHFPVGEFWSPLPVSDLHPSLQDALADRKIPARCLPPGWTTLERTDLTTNAIFVPEQSGKDLNDRSLVVYCRKGADGVLLTGDLETKGVAQLLGAPPPGPVTLLKLPHHGSRGSSPQLLVKRFSPDLAFVSVGAGNPHGLPHRTVVDYLRQRRVPLHRTDQDGSLRFTTEGKGWKAEHWVRGLFR
ncbi:DNA internalization-related competence protein ComEC/Rec2 [uncultured Desulfuromonas sp.]|uniref:DNA internalization-related competence protein ComEC/Rec2 n=1 Tax=uncultured Desulfuromonas sp. TaxID=181013 RepID=UPI00262F7F43|nr:DNA internalization-related competence protein ComEC/Rec2 [uncultured Desulfuromonas sp.]